ncbi:hypothetical protein ACTFIR_005255 [Dictyostelium discoideum]
MEKLVEFGLVKSIGVSNFNVQNFVDLLSYTKIKPVVNQVEIHPYLTQLKLQEYCEKYEIKLVAYSPLGQGKCIPTIPKSGNHSRIIENFNIFDFQLSNEDIEKIKFIKFKFSCLLSN